MAIDAVRRDLFLTKLAILKEDEFTKNVVRPLFLAMGYYKADFNGGAYERGKDLIAYKHNLPDLFPYVAVVQTKKLEGSQNIGLTNKTRTLISQLQQCYTDKVPLDDGSIVRPDAIYLCCPEVISHRFLEDLNGQLFMEGREVQPLDGNRIIDLLYQLAPVYLG